jgi:hypothetical protein
MQSYDEARFRAGVEGAMRAVRTILDNTKNPQYPADVPHRYNDKYLLAEFLTRTGVAAVFQALQTAGLSADNLPQLIGWAKNRTVTLRLNATETCTFLREESKKVESAQHVTEKKTRWGGTETTTEKIVTTVKEYFWNFEFRYELVAFVGNEDDKALPLYSRAGKVEIKTAAKTTPRPEKVIRPKIDANITWLLSHLDAERRAFFTIDRTAKSCHTPRRNQQIEDALWAFNELGVWCQRIHGYFWNELFPAQQEHGRDLSAIHAREVFVPVLPLFEAERSSNDSVVGAESAQYAAPFLAEQKRSLENRHRQLGEIFPKDNSVITVVEATLMTTMLHLVEVCQRHSDGVDYIEQMLEDQLVAAIGKYLTPTDFTAYMNFHHRKLFQAPFQPQPFSYAVRRPEHDPEGVLSIDAEQGGPLSEPITTAVARSEHSRPMQFALDAATRVTFHGDRYLHAWISHQFSGQSNLSLNLIARARQFSNFILLVGRIVSADTFEPKLGIIIQNKDLLKIPLMLEQIPTPKEFRDAIESLSPEQQRFAKAFRSMQLESTLFGVCIIQIKPQLEALLKLPPDSLTKEIKLTQDVLRLFIEYQIPSDLISYDGPAENTQEAKLAKVTEHVSKMLAMIDFSKQREIEEAREREALRLAEANRTPYPYPQAPPDFASVAGPTPAPPMSMPAMPMMSAPPPAPGGVQRSAVPPVMTKSAARPMAPPSVAAPTGAAVPMTPAPPPPPPIPAPTNVVSDRAAPPEPTPSPKRNAGGDMSGPAPASSGELIDYTRIPTELDKRFEEIDEDDAVRPTIINTGDVWNRSSQKGLLAAPANASLYSNEQKGEKNKAFDLLDALSRSGALPIEHASLHVVIAATHCFDKTLVDTVIQDNVNPIEKVERSMMVVATTIHRKPAIELLTPDQRDRFLTASPRLAIPPAKNTDGKKDDDKP